MNHSQPHESLIALAFLFVVALFLGIKSYKEHLLINKAALALGIPTRLVGFFRVDLMSLYQHQPLLKTTKYSNNIEYFVKKYDKAHYQCIMTKLDHLLAKEEEYGEAFVDELYYGHNV